MVNEMLIKIFVVLVMIAIIASLGSALRYLTKGEEYQEKLVKALTVRISISLALFILLMVMALTGIIKPHGIREGLKQRPPPHGMRGGLMQRPPAEQPTPNRTRSQGMKRPSGNSDLDEANQAAP